MGVKRKWFCTCSGTPLELEYPLVPVSEDDPGEPVCRLCGASPSSDPRKTVYYEDVDDRED
ncbi:hypothetical protein [Trichloromonas sp.]|uniref:hypothetical protein n=1 Tax=Trichloromonas sp. TaxID=3069249 RepID=UPI002A3CFF18|nr:hypothetical protein [Trichloromonas sp.]